MTKIDLIRTTLLFRQQILVASTPFQEKNIKAFECKYSYSNMVKMQLQLFQYDQTQVLFWK